jgi:ABC-2 type transport system ATP-binding protein
MPKEIRKKRINEALETCGLTHMRSKRIEELSKGYKQRVGLAQAILHDPPILILDEPTTGLDPNQIIEIRSLIKELGKRKTVILSTHILQEVEAVCNQVLIINEGRIAAQGTPEEIAGTMKGGDTWELTLKGAYAHTIADRLLLLGEGISPASVKEQDGNLDLTFFIPPQDDSSAEGERIFDWAVSQGYKILRMNRKRLSIEDIFVKLTNEAPAAESGAAAASRGGAL